LAPQFPYLVALQFNPPPITAS